MTVIWDVAVYSLVDIDQHFTGIALMMKAVSTTETLVNVYQTAWYDSPEDGHPGVYIVCANNVFFLLLCVAGYQKVT
jgi:hypothetical protein